MTPAEEAALAELVWELSAPHSAEAIAEHIGCDRTTVWRIELAALNKMRERLQAEGKDWSGPLKEPRESTAGRARTHIRDKNTR